MDRRLAAIIAADVVEYSRLMGEAEEETHERLNSYLEIIKQAAARHSGRVFGEFADSLLAEFASSVEAVRCSIEIQSQLGELNARLPKDRRMLVRIGINLGDVLVKKENLYGDGVNIAARIEGLAPPGGIAITGEVFRQVNKKIHCQFQDIGEKRVKNITEPIHVYNVVTADNHTPKNSDILTTRPSRLGLTGLVNIALALVLITMTYFLFSYTFPSGDVARGKPSIAVLPIRNLSQDSSKQYVSDGITNDIITDLSKFDGLFVPSSYSSFYYKERSASLEEIASSLGVRYILEGSVQKENNSIRINAQLVDTKYGKHIWAERYSYPDVQDLFSIQDSIVNQVVRRVIDKIDMSELNSVTDKLRTNNTTAQELYWKGEEAFGEECETRESCDRSRTLFEQAIKADENFAGAYGWLAYVIAQGWYHGIYEESELKLAEKLALRAVSLDGSDYSNYWSLAEVQHRVGKLDDAYLSYQAALELNGNDAELLADWAEFLNKRGEQSKALETISEAIALTPVNPPDYFFWDKAYIEYFLTKHDESLLSLSKMKKKPVWSRALFAANYARLDRPTDARREMSEFLSASKETKGWTLATEFETEASTFSREANIVYLLQGLKNAGMPLGKLPESIREKLD